MDRTGTRHGLFYTPGRLAAAVVLGAAVGAAACPPVPSEPQAQPGPARALPAAVDQTPAEPDGTTNSVIAEFHRRRLSMEKELRKVRAKHFGDIKVTEVRQIGIARLAAFTDPAIFPALLEVFQNEGQDVRGAVLDHLADQKSDLGDATIAWGAVFDRDAWFRTAAGERLAARIAATGGPSNRVRTVIAEGLRRHDDRTVVAAARLAGTLKLYELIPQLVTAQLVQAPAGGAGGGGSFGQDGALADIFIGTQQAFVADLTPVVGDSAVAFDPTLAVVTEGTVLRVIDAVVVTYRIEVHGALVGLADAAWDGRTTAPLGWDAKRWAAWYENELKPYRAGLASASAVK